MEFSITSDVYAPADLMFAVLTDVERWPGWTSTVTRVERLDTSSRPFGVGSRIRIVQPKVRPAEWTVTALEAGRGFRRPRKLRGSSAGAKKGETPRSSNARGGQDCNATAGAGSCDAVEMRVHALQVRSDFHQTPVLERPGGRHAAVHDVR